MQAAPHDESLLPKLALGTVQFGLPYGLAHKGAPVDPVEVGKILHVAWRAGIDLLDTAQNYGSAEEVICRARPTDAHFQIVSKLSRVALASQRDSGDDDIMRSVIDSRTKLAVDRLYGLLLHHAPDLLSPEGPRLFAKLKRMQAEGIVSRLGVSVYDLDTLRALLDRYEFEIVQLPLNVLDQRFRNTEIIPMMRRAGVEVHIRSVFLQGALLSNPDSLDGRVSALRSYVRRFQNLAERAGLSPVEASLSFAANTDGVTHVVIGVDKVAQLAEIVAAFKVARFSIFDASMLGVDDLDLIDPRRWQ
jgi:aryl-alcohol dehydrogenase-like predicted oxidoreductase